MSIYPKLETEPTQFRLQEISNIQTKLEHESGERAKLCKKYKRAENILDAIDIGTNGLALSLGVTTGVLAGTGILLPFAIPFGITSACAASLGITCKFINRKLKRKFSKYSNIRQLAMSKLNSVLGIISKAIEDNKISDEEFKLVRDEMEKYNELKAQIQTKVSKNQNVTEEEKRLIIEQAKRDFINQLKLNSNVA